MLGHRHSASHAEPCAQHPPATALWPKTPGDDNPATRSCVQLNVLNCFTALTAATFTHAKCRRMRMSAHSPQFAASDEKGLPLPVGAGLPPEPFQELHPVLTPLTVANSTQLGPADPQVVPTRSVQGLGKLHDVIILGCLPARIVSSASTSSTCEALGQ